MITLLYLCLLCVLCGKKNHRTERYSQREQKKTQSREKMYGERKKEARLPDGTII
jgi:hypothetical protein